MKDGLSQQQRNRFGWAALAYELDRRIDRLHDLDEVLTVERRRVQMDSEPGGRAHLAIGLDEIDMALHSLRAHIRKLRSLRQMLTERGRVEV